MKTKLLEIRGILQIGIICSIGVTVLTGSTRLGQRLVLNTINESTINVKGIVIHSRYDRSSFFPKEWLVDPINCNGTQVAEADAQRIIPIIEQFASSYNVDVVKDNLTDIYLLGGLMCFGKSYGGTNSLKAIYIKVASSEEGDTDQFLLSLLHAEFSSVLMRNYPFPIEEWKAVNVEDFAYSNDAVECLGQAGLQISTPELFAAGFLDHYATTTLENDFNEYAAWLFVRHKELCDARDQYERVARKYELATKFYASVDPALRFSTCE